MVAVVGVHGGGFWGLLEVNGGRCITMWRYGFMVVLGAVWGCVGGMLEVLGGVFSVTMV